MAINNQDLGTSANPVTARAQGTDAVRPNIIDHNTTEESFQAGLDDIAVQVDRNQIDLGYSTDVTDRTGVEARTVNARVATAEGLLGIDANGNQTAAAASNIAVGTATFDGSMNSSHIGGSLANLRINAGAVDTAQLAMGAVESAQIEDGTIVSADLSATAGVQRTQLETAIQNYSVRTGGASTSADVQTVNLGAMLDIPVFTTASDGVVDGPEAAEATDATENLYVLGSDNNWHRLNNFARHGQQVPAGDITYTTTSHQTTAAVPTGTALADFIALGVNRVEGSMNTQYGLENGDIVTLTNTTPDPDQTVAFVYIGASLAAGADGTATDFVRIGVAEDFGFATNGGIEFTTGTRNLQLAEPIPGDRSFAGELQTDGLLDINANIDIASASRVVGNIIPNVDETQSLGSTTNRWQVNAHDVNFDGTLTGTVGNSNITDRTINVNKLDPTGSTAMQIPTSAGPSADVTWMDPPIGVERLSTLPTNFSDYPIGTLVALIMTDGSNDPGTYRSTGSAWERLGVVNTVYTTDPFNTLNNGTQTIFNRSPNFIPATHFVTVDGLVLVENVDYTLSADGFTITLTSAVGNDRDIVIHKFADVAMIGTGQLDITALGAGNLPTGVRLDGATQILNEIPVGNLPDTYNFGNGWTIESSANGLRFVRNGTAYLSIDNDGDMVAARDVTAFGTVVS